MAAHPQPHRLDYYQTDTHVHVSVYVKGVPPDSVRFAPEPQRFALDASQHTLARSTLFAPIDPAASTHDVRSTKVELHLAKAQPGLHWPRLHTEHGEHDESAHAPAPVIPASILPPDAPVRKKNKWEDFKLEDEDEDAGPAPGKVGSGKAAEGDVNEFFKQLYAGASDDARRAMVKSYQESNGTTLSMNWDEVKKGKVETKPPESMEARRYE